jgi:hypothetical protein
VCARRVLTYDDQELVGLELSRDIRALWASGQFRTLAELTGALYERHSSIPRSALFWLSYHVVFGEPESVAGNQPG